MGTYRLFGLTLASDLPLPAPPGGDNPADLAFQLSAEPFDRSETAFRLVYESPRSTPDGESLATLERSDRYERLRFLHGAEFLLGSDRIVAKTLEPGAESVLETHLLGPVLSYWLERRGLPTLHASAVAVATQAVAFLSSQGSGKTGLAAALMRAGHPLLTDDILPVEERDGIFLGRPGYPQMRMWPDEAGYFLGAFEDLDRVHPTVSKRRIPIGSGRFGAFHGSSLPLACLYLPERREGGSIEIQEVSPRDAFIELVRHSFSPNLVEAAGLQAGRMEIFARLVTRIPVRRLLYPSGFEHLDRVAETILRDL
jgi:hypothetical protein